VSNSDLVPNFRPIFGLKFCDTIFPIKLQLGKRQISGFGPARNMALQTPDFRRDIVWDFWQLVGGSVLPTGRDFLSLVVARSRSSHRFRLR